MEFNIENSKYFLHKKKLKKFIDWLAYGSLLLDICIAIITLSSMFYPVGIVTYLGPVNIALSIVVVFSIVSAAMIVGIKFYEEMLFRKFMIKVRVKNHLNGIKHRVTRLKHYTSRLRTSKV
jgi:membrane protease YdiL (CAAX protease family)